MARTDTPEYRLRAASRQLAMGKTDEARALLDGLPSPTTLSDRAAYVSLHRDLGAPLTDVEAQLDADLERSCDTSTEAYERAQALFLLDRSEALEAANAAVSLSGADEGPIFLLLKLHLAANRPDAARDTVLATADQFPRPGGLLLAAAKILGQDGHKSQAVQLLDAALPYQQDNLAEFNFVSAGIKGTRPTGASQSDMAEAIFDKFAGDYDKVLSDIGYSAPDMIGELLSALTLKKMKRLQVLDAGCGTGLCAKLLRPYAKSLHGADISAPMLQKAKKRNIYNVLTRSDLNAPATIPAGPFDLVVFADVLIYFGDLAPVLSSMAQRLQPGGWLLLTVEDGGALEAPGFQLGASGRYKHSKDHITAALSATGFGRPKHILQRTLRHEFGTPVEGMAIAAQRPMLAL